MSAHPLMSVIIPNYNYAAYLGQAIDSALGQSYPAVEVLVVDDGSTDGSEAVLRGYGDRIRWLRQARQGVSAARNRGVRESRGELIAFLDADDAWEREKLARQVDKLTDPTVGVVICGLCFIDPTGVPLDTVSEGRSGYLLRDLVLLRLEGSPGFGSTALIRRSCFEHVGLFDPRLSTSADWDLWRRISCHYQTAMVREPLVRYRLHRTSMHCNVELFEHDMLLAMSSAFIDPAARLIHPLRRRSFGRLYVILSGSYLQAGRLDRCLAYAMRSVLTWPPSLGSLMAFPVRRLRPGLRRRIGDPAAQVTLRHPQEAVAGLPQRVGGRVLP